MINKFNHFFIVFFLSLIFVKSIIAEEIFFDSPEILVLENGDLIKSPKGGKVTTNNNIIIYADKFEYDKILSILTATGNVQVFDNNNNTETKAKKVVYNKNEEILTATGNVNILDKVSNIDLSAEETVYFKKEDTFKGYENVIINDKNNQIILETNEIIYERKKDKIKSIDKTKIFVKNEYFVETSNITFLIQDNHIFSNNFTKLKDKNENIYSAENFRYYLNDKIFRGQNLYILTKTQDKYFFEDGIVDLISEEIVGKDLEAYFKKQFKNADSGLGPNEPRLKGNSGFSNENKTIVNKAAFTSCKIRNDKCPPWVIEAQEIEHDKKKKIIYYKNAWLKLYNVPVLYYPRFFHPDPTVERQSGFLKPSTSRSEELGSSIYLPYFYVLSDSQDLTFKPRFFDDDKSILQTEFRDVSKNSETIADISYSSGHKSSGTDGSRGHLFIKSNIDFDMNYYDKSRLDINFEKTTNDTYLKLFQLESPLLIDRDLSTTKTQLKFSANKEDLDIVSSISMFERLSGPNSDRYEYILPDFSINKTIDTADYPGFLEFYSSGSHNIFETNKSETKLINDLNYASDSQILNNGIKNDFNILFKNTNSIGKNSSNFETSLGQDFLTTFLYKTSFPLKKNGISINDYLTPKAIFRYSPHGMNKITNAGLDIGKIFANNRIGSADTFESGKSLTLGFEYNKEKKADRLKILSAELGSIYRLSEEENLGSDNSMNKKKSDIVGKIDIEPFEENYLNYNFAMSDDLNTFNSHSLTLKTSVNNFVTKWDYIENFVGTNTIHKIGFDGSYEFDSSNKIGFSSSRNENINFTEYYDAYYQYQNDCLTARVAYNKSFYTDRDMKPSETLFLSLTIIPLGGYDSKNLLGGY